MAKRKKKPVRPAQPAPEPEPRTKPDRRLWYGVIAVVIVGLAAFVWFVNRGPGTAAASLPDLLASAPDWPDMPTAPLSTNVPDAQSQARFDEGVELAQRGQFEEALAAFRDVRRRHPDSPEVIANIGKACLELGRAQEAAEAYQEVIRLDPREPVYHDMLGVAYGELGNIEASLASFEKAIGLDPQFASAYNNAGTAYAQNQDLPNAIAMFEQAIAVQPDMSRAYGNLVRCYLQLGQEEKIEPLMERLLAVNPNDPMARQVLQDLRTSAQE